MTLGELIAQWRRNAATLNLGYEGEQMEVGFNAGYNEAAGELEDWAKHNLATLIAEWRGYMDDTYHDAAAMLEDRLTKGDG